MSIARIECGALNLCWHTKFYTGLDQPGFSGSGSQVRQDSRMYIHGLDQTGSGLGWILDLDSGWISVDLDLWIGSQVDHWIGYAQGVWI